MTDEIDDPIFPPQWRWRKYEPAFRELMNRLAQTQEADAPYGRWLHTKTVPQRLDYEGVKTERWWTTQNIKGNLPREIFDFQNPRSHQVDAIFNAALARARLRLRGAQKTLTFFGQRPNLTERYNPPSGELIPKNDNELNQPAPATPGHTPSRTFTCAPNSRVRGHRR